MAINDHSLMISSHNLSLATKNNNIDSPKVSTCPTGADISAFYKHSGGLVQWSPNGRFLAVGKENRLSIRDGTTLEIVHSFSCSDAIQLIEWSDDSTYILTGMYRRSVVQVWSIEDPSWTCKLTESLAGMIFAKWTPDSRHIITVSDFRVHITVWSLLDRSSFVIRHPKLGAEGISFSPGGRYVAVAERMECKDYIGIYCCEKWELVRHFPVESHDLVKIEWSENNRVISVQDTHLEYRVLFYSTEGKLINNYEAYQHALGVKTASWSPTGQFLAMGSYDQIIRIFSSVSMKPIASLNHTAHEEMTDAIGYQEIDSILAKESRNKDADENSSGNSSISMKYSQSTNSKQVAPRSITFKPMPMPIPMPEIPHEEMKENLRVGVGIVAWSSDSKYLVSRNDSTPNTIWIWRTELMALHSCVVQLSPIKSIRWNPTNNQLAFCTGNNRIYFWSPDGTSWIDIPGDDLRILGLRWNPDGKSLILLGKQDLCCVYL